MTLKAQLLADLPTFLDVGEFAEARSIDGGGAVPCVLDEEKGTYTAEGVYLVASTLYVKTASLSAVPVVGQRMTIDGRPGDVVSVTEDDGLLTIRLRWYES